MYRAALHSKIRYDLELTSGEMVDSREAAQRAIANLNRAKIASR